MQIHQLIPGLSVGDAVTNHALEIQKILRGMGIPSELFSVPRHVSPHLKKVGHDYREHAPLSSPKNGVIYHFSIGSELSQYFQQLPDKKVMIYHNITPAKYFRGLNDQKALDVEEGRKQLETLSSVPDLALGVSNYNRLELVEAGYAKTGVFPLILDPTQWNLPPRRGILNQYRDGKVNILFVGRSVPNKKIEDVLKVFYYYQKTIQPRSRLLLVGPYVGMEKYVAYLKALALELDLQNVVFTGHVSDAELKTYYRVADLYLCMSEHEGFCIPLLEAMHFNVPIVAYDACAIRETLGENGVLIKNKNYVEIAELMDKILSNEKLKLSLTKNQKERLAEFNVSHATSRLKKVLETLAS